MTTETVVQQSLFDEYGRRIPFPGMRTYSSNGSSARQYVLARPQMQYLETCRRIGTNLGLTADEACAIGGHVIETWEGIMGAICKNAQVLNLVNAVSLPFFCRPKPHGTSRAEDIRYHLGKLGSSFRTAFPESGEQGFVNLCQSEGKPGDDITVAPGSRYEQFEQARGSGFVVGWYFPNCLSEYDVDSQRRQMATLPEALPLIRGGEAKIVLSGIVDAAGALIGYPGLFFGEANKQGYPNHLCCSALKEPSEGQEDDWLYTFEGYGLRKLVFKRRSNWLTPGVTQVSEQWAGGLTVFSQIS